MKSKLNSNKYVITRPCRIRTMLLMQCMHILTAFYHLTIGLVLFTLASRCFHGEIYMVKFSVTISIGLK